MMKYLFLVAIICVAVKAQTLSKEEIEKIKAMHEACLKESSVDRTLVNNAMKQDYADDPKLKEHIFCCNKKLGFQTDSGDIVEDVTVKKLVEKFPDEAIVTNAVKQCAQKKATPAETGFEFVKCLHSMAPKSLDVGSFFI